MPRPHWLLLLICASLPAAGNPELQMELIGGLGGQTVSGRSSEFGVRLFASDTTHGELLFSDLNGDSSVPVTIPGQTDTRLWIPVNPAPFAPLRVRLVTSAGQVIDRELPFEQQAMPITLVTRSMPGAQPHASHPPASSVRPVIVGPDSLPRSSQAYAGVAAMVTDLPSLSGLSTEQYRAFASYLGGCNILLLSATSPALLEQLRKLSGCGGKFIQRYETLEQVAPLLQTLAAERSATAPSAQHLLALQLPSWRDDMAASLTLYLAGYILFMALVNWRMQETRYLLLLPVIVAGAGMLAWSGSGAVRSISWSEAQSGDSYSRVSTLLLLGGNTRGESSVAVDDDAPLARVGGGAQPSHIRYADQGARRVVAAQTDLLTPVAYQLDQARRQALPYTLQLRQGWPEVVLRAEPPVNHAILLWRGYTYRLPELAKGESWRPHEAQQQPALSAAAKLLQRYLHHESPALLLPYTAAQDSVAAPGQSQGWLVIRPAPGPIL